MFLGPEPAWIALLLVATFAGGVANLIAIVGFMVTATSDLPNDEQGLATGLATMSQQVGITMGIPIMSAIVTTRMNALGGESAGTLLDGIAVALVVNAVLCVVAAGLVALLLRSPAPASVSPARG